MVYGDPNVQLPVPPVYADTDERIWNEFVGNSKERFAETASAERAYAEFTKLETKNDQINTYITTFEHLLSKAGWEQAVHRTLEKFEQRSPEMTALGHLATRPHPDGIRRLTGRCTTRNPKEKTGPSKSETSRR